MASMAGFLVPATDEFLRKYIYTKIHKIMNTEIQRYQIGNPLTVAEHFAKSGLFEDSKDMSKALVKILAGRELGLPDMASMTGIHIIKGKPVLGANLIASLIKGSQKYDYRVVQLNDKVCHLDFYERNTKIGESVFTIEDAQKAGTMNIQKFPKNMLFARAISNGAKWFCPDVFNGQTVYSEGELDEVQIKAEPQIVPERLTLGNPNPEKEPWEIEPTLSFGQKNEFLKIAATKKMTVPTHVDNWCNKYFGEELKNIPSSKFNELMQKIQEKEIIEEIV
jgi:hypothetical protein